MFQWRCPLESYQKHPTEYKDRVDDDNDDGDDNDDNVSVKIKSLIIKRLKDKG
jgi:hypothetical protein